MRWSVLGWLGIALHCTVVVFYYLMLLLIAPTYVIYLLWALWVALLALAFHLVGRRPAAAFGVPFLALALWYAVILFGEQVLGWTA